MRGASRESEVQEGRGKAQHEADRRRAETGLAKQGNAHEAVQGICKEFVLLFNPRGRASGDEVREAARSVSEQLLPLFNPRQSVTNTIASSNKR